MKNDLFSFFIVFNLNALCFSRTDVEIFTVQLKHVPITSMKNVLTGYSNSKEVIPIKMAIVPIQLLLAHFINELMEFKSGDMDKPKEPSQ